ncbi:MAG TPA: HEAT repeat domain-containing protein [Kofleriaceae bacterium]|jgi:hypothetical protein|nr:HEAT repeat domain-containing protein [Kofleriaceae bacterium]
MIRTSQVVSLLVVPILWTAEVTAGPASKAGDRAPRAATGLSSDDASVRRQAITKLVVDRDPSAVAQLSLALESDSDEAVRQEAAAGLGDLGDRRGATALQRCLQVEPSQAVKRNCRVALAKLAPPAATADPSQPASAPAATTATTAPAPSTTTTTAPTGTTPASPQFDLRINVTPEDAAARPNHVYLELVSAADSTLALGFERVVGPQWSLAIEPQLSAQSQSVSGLKASTFGAALAVRPHYYFLQQAPSGPYIAPLGSIGYYRVSVEFGQSKQVVSGTTWAVGAGVGWSLVVNARAVFNLSAVFAYARTAATVSTTGMAESSWAADFRPFVSAGVMF